MNLSQELINVLEKTMKTNEYFNPYIILGILNGIEEGCENWIFSQEGNYEKEYK